MKTYQPTNEPVEFTEVPLEDELGVFLLVNQYLLDRDFKSFYEDIRSWALFSFTFNLDKNNKIVMIEPDYSEE